MRDRTIVIAAGIIVGMLCIATWGMAIPQSSSADVVGTYVFNGRYYLTAPMNISKNWTDHRTGNHYPCIYGNKIAWNIRDVGGISHVITYDIATGELPDAVDLKSRVDPATTNTELAYYENSGRGWNMVAENYTTATSNIVVSGVQENSGQEEPDANGNELVFGALQGAGFREYIFHYDIAADSTITLNSNPVIEGYGYALQQPTVENGKIAMMGVNISWDRVGVILYDVERDNYTMVNGTLNDYIQNVRALRDNRALCTGADANGTGIRIINVGTGHMLYHWYAAYPYSPTPVWMAGNFVTYVLQNESGNYDMRLLDISTNESINLPPTPNETGVDYLQHNIYRYDNGTYGIVNDMGYGAITLQFLIPSGNEQAIKHYSQFSNVVPQSSLSNRNDLLLLIGLIILVTTAGYAIYTRDRKVSYYEK